MKLTIKHLKALRSVQRRTHGDSAELEHPEALADLIAVGFATPTAEGPSLTVDGALWLRENFTVIGQV